VATINPSRERWFLRGSTRDLPEATLAHQGDGEARATRSALPAEVEISTVSGLALLCHGLGANDMGKVLADDQATGSQRTKICSGC